MRSLIIFHFALIPMVCIAQKKHHFFKLTGEVVNIKEGIDKVYMSYFKNRVEILDSAKVKKGKYYFSGHMEEPVLAIVRPKYYKLTGDKFKETNYFGQAIIIFIEPSNISIKNIHSFDSSIVEGSNANIEYRKLMAKAKFYDDTLQMLDRKYENCKDSIIKENINEQRSKVYNEKKELVYLGYLKKNIKTVIAMYILKYYTDGDINIGKVKPLYDMLPQNVKNSPSGQLFKIKMENVTKLAVMKPAIDFTQNDNRGNPVQLNSFRNKYVLLDFWASWCIPCREQNPSLKKIFLEFRKMGFRIISVSLDADKRKWLDAVKKDAMTWINLSDLKGWANAVAIKYNVEDIPKNFLIDPKGAIIEKNIWGEDLEKKLTKIFTTIK